MAKGHENLVPSNMRSKDEARANSKKGGIKSGEARRAKKEEQRQMKSFCEILAQIMQQPLKKEEAKEALKDVGITEPTLKDGIMYRLSTLALKGDLRALEMTIKLTGDDNDREKLTGQKIDVTSKGNSLSTDIKVEVIDKREQVDKQE